MIGIKGKRGGVPAEQTAPSRTHEPIQVFRQTNADFGGKEGLEVHWRFL